MQNITFVLISDLGMHRWNN